MRSYFTVIWRDQGDEYMVTTVDVPEEQAGNMTSQDFVLEAARVEYAGFEDLEDTLDDLIEKGYDLIGVILGEVAWVA